MEAKRGEGSKKHIPPETSQPTIDEVLPIWKRQVLTEDPYAEVDLGDVAKASAGIQMRDKKKEGETMDKRRRKNMAQALEDMRRDNGPSSSG